MKSREEVAYFSDASMFFVPLFRLTKQFQRGVRACAGLRLCERARASVRMCVMNSPTSGLE